MRPSTGSRASPRPMRGISLEGALGRRAAVLLLCAAFACKRERGSMPAEPSAQSAVVRGQIVVVEKAAAVFEETRVLEVKSGRLRVDSADGGDSIWIASADVYSTGRVWTPPPGA